MIYFDIILGLRLSPMKNNNSRYNMNVSMDSSFNYNIH